MIPPERSVNHDSMVHVRDHPLTARVRGRICHATTLQNALSILDDGRIKVVTARDGIHRRQEGAPLSACIANDAVSVFDFDVPDDQLFPTVPAHSGLHEYLYHWWSFLTELPDSVVILLDASVRERFVEDPQAGGTRQFIWGTECCHRGDITSEHFSGYLLVEDSGQEARTFGVGDESRLRAEVEARLAAPRLAPSLSAEQGEARRRLFEILHRASGNST